MSEKSTENYFALQRLAAKLAARGYQKSLTFFEADWKVYCDQPVIVSHRARGGRDFLKTDRTYGPYPGDVTHYRPLEVVMHVPCRKCDKCLQFRQMRWRERATNELLAAKRSWFMTLTFAPVHLAGILSEASLNKKQTGEKAIDAAAYSHVSRYFKRLRKQKLQFRYLAVFERGEQTGRAHYHLLLHEVGDRPVLKRVLQEQWRSHVHCRLVTEADDGTASYITKYTTKSFEVAPRASLHYGDPAYAGRP